ncbi:MAG TPA: SprT-like domain-containing protein [Bacteroidia bacterium]|nr:SprT-like domain-containing protein [Bacteroidia bacterium]
MSQLERNKAILTRNIPERAVPLISEWIYSYDFKLKIKKGRSSKYGDYRPPQPHTNHQISVNRDLNPYAFLVTLVHEIAHLSSWQKHGNRPRPHGSEWKQEFREHMKPFFQLNLFPEDIHRALARYLTNPAASSCSDIHLLRVLKKYDGDTGAVFLEDIPAGTVFLFGKGRHFRKGEKIRKRFSCLELHTRRHYLFNPLSEVTPVAGTLFP